VTDQELATTPVDMPIEVLLGKAPRMIRSVRTSPKLRRALSTAGASIADSLDRLLCLPTIADKSFLITIGDRTVGGLISRDQMVGPWQVPVSDVAVSLSSFEGYSGEAMAMGERAPVAVLDAPASGRLAVGEAITNIIAADVQRLIDIRLSANWMAACGEPGEDADLYATVRAVSLDLCAKLGITIPVGKDSLSMRTVWNDADGAHSVIAPVSLIVSAFAPVTDARRTLTPQLDLSQPSRLLLIDLGAGKNRLGGSCWAQVFGLDGGEPADLDDPELLREMFAAVRALKDQALAARLSRSFRRRPAGDAAGDGICRTLRTRHHAGRGGCDCRVFCRRVGSGHPSAGGARARGTPHTRTPRARRALQRYRRARGRQRGAFARRGPSGVFALRASICTGAGARYRFACRRCATIRNAPAKSSPGYSTSTIPACTPH
jgi:phosphoribosylformylglycinamidine synthase